MFGQSVDETSAVQFTLDSHHLALLDRFVARARRHAQRTGRQFTGVVVEVDPTRPISVQAADLPPMMLGLEACIAGETTVPGPHRAASALEPTEAHSLWSTRLEPFVESTCFAGQPAH
jgi:hypothetical protein